MSAFGKMFWISAHNRLIPPKLTLHQVKEWHHGGSGVDRTMADAARQWDQGPEEDDGTVARVRIWRRRLIMSSVCMMLIGLLAFLWSLS